jgi:DNA-binding IclR family transcriptional regulator
MDVLRALARKPTGMRYTEIQYDVVRGSATDVILRELIQVGLAEWRADLYFITAAGKKIASVGEVVAEVSSHSNGNGGVGVR